MTTANLLHQRFGEGLPAHPALEDPFLARVLARRTCRRYNDRPVEPALVDALLNVAFAASSKSDFQQASVIVVRDPERRRAIGELVPAMPWIGSAPVFLIFCADANRLEAACALRGKTVQNRNLEAFFNASVDAALVMQTFILAAEQIGLGCCPISVIRNHLPKVRTLLALPDRVVPVAGLCVGNPAEPGHVSMRLPPTVTRHIDCYDDNAVASEIDRYDRQRAQRAPIPRDKQRSPDKFGYAEFYGWSEDKSRQAEAGEGRDFGSMVRASGFLLD